MATVARVKLVSRACHDKRGRRPHEKQLTDIMLVVWVDREWRGLLGESMFKPEELTSRYFVVGAKKVQKLHIYLETES